ncbi:MAG TPA: ABC transporter ATP-binding protein [Bacteroidia bacterium]|nr:ABC transporter ATP-binding protein [Bacteroidia bacterium]
MNHEIVLQAKELRKTYGPLVAVDNVSFTVKKGDIFGFLGPNGAGKSTTLRMILGLIQPSAGEVLIFNRPLSGSRSSIMKRIGAIVEKPDLYGYLTAYDNLRILGRLAGTEVGKERILQVLELVGLEDRAYSKVKTYSQGMKQRLGIGQALLHDPELILLDEPTNGLDPQGMVEIRELIKKLSSEHRKTILLSTHILNEVEMIATRMVIISKGKVAVEGNVKELLQQDDLHVTLDTNDNTKALNLLQQNGFKSTAERKETSAIELNISKEQIPNVCKLLMESGMSIYSITPVRSLEAFFLSLT